MKRGEEKTKNKVCLFRLAKFLSYLDGKKITFPFGMTDNELGGVGKGQ